jgi:hypothetical protein
MTRPEALTKLLALGPLRREQIRAITGWSLDDVIEVLSHLRASATVRYRYDGHGNREYLLCQEVSNPFHGVPA